MTFIDNIYAGQRINDAPPDNEPDAEGIALDERLAQIDRSVHPNELKLTDKIMNAGDFGIDDNGYPVWRDGFYALEEDENDRIQGLTRNH